MATIMFGAAGMALGGAAGGSVLGLSGAVWGRAGGAALGRAIDARLLGAGADPVETGRIDRFRLTGAGEGAPIARLWGRMRIGGQVIWASEFEERSATSGGGKGAPRPEITEYSYAVSLAIGLCEGPVRRIARIWADGVELGREEIAWRLYEGHEDQRPDPKIEAVEGIGRAPAYRGLAYVVIEDLDLARFGNRVPQFSFEVLRPADVADPAGAEDLARLVRGVAVIPGTGEYGLATTPVHVATGFGERRPANRHGPSGPSDAEAALDDLVEELPDCRAASLVVSWFGDDLRAGHCTIRPKVEQREDDGEEMPWHVSGLVRADAMAVPRIEDRPVYGGTPSDRAVIEAIRAMAARGLEVTYYPFILMDRLPGNGLPDPHGGAEQAPLPWRGRITTAIAPGQPGTTDRTAGAEAEVAAFFGTARAEDFTITPDGPAYHGPEDWGLRRFVLHQAHLCAMAGGVEAFCIGSEMVGLTTIRGADDGYPAVAALRDLAAQVRGILGPGVKLSYAADWSEYHGHQPGGATKRFHLDPLWADPEIDFIGIDNYMPLSDWRDGVDHLDATDHRSIYDLDYLAGNVAGGEGHDWYYHSPEARAAQIRTPISDGDGEPWVWRYKDLKGWWGNAHHDRIDGVRQAAPTAWQPGMKPIRFTELGCAAIDRGTNQPNKFLDPKSSESARPHQSRGHRDELIQMQYLRAVHRHFADPAANPVSVVYGGPMLDTERMLVWAWDLRPYPWFPGLAEVWNDGANWARGHWITGRTAHRDLASVVAEICAGAGVTAIDTSRLHGLVRGYVAQGVQSARALLQPLMLAHGFDAVERDGVLVFRSRDGRADAVLDPGGLARVAPEAPVVEIARDGEAALPDRVRLGYVAAETGAAGSVEAALPGHAPRHVETAELPMVLCRGEAQAIAARWLAETRLGRETAGFALPPSAHPLGAGDVVEIAGAPGGGWRIDRLERTAHAQIEAVRCAPAPYLPAPAADETEQPGAYLPPVPVEGVFLDLPLLTGAEAPHAPHFAATANPWPGAVALVSGVEDADHRLQLVQPLAATIGTTLTALGPAPAGLWDRGPALRVRLAQGRLTGATQAALLSGANLAAIGDGESDHWELLQFARAEPVAPGVYDVSLRLRGQAGTDAVMPDVWPAGSRFVLLDGAPRQVDLPQAARGLERHYRYGPARRPLTDPSWRHEIRAFAGIGLRPYAPVHLRARADGDDLAISWIRRARSGADGWEGREVPLDEGREAYLLRIVAGGVLLREAEVGAPRYRYTAAARLADGAAEPLAVQVAQISDAFGAGPFATLTVTP
ncbi:baseplate multidomain protein megatron [Limimaricola hongkongensis]|uniref:GTA host specificity protein n=1 Tax=Limimaricola hongkongensis DSM 17492 TaxID=1122180 RepID=A0A017HJ27_9RHOB|nr:glycoside hydrolase/phage tail family protein [Limimaricola hongkongensis]EYD73789.1 GTA host specificity protein [Limimaricola hongkongensis DSM 17492]